MIDGSSVSYFIQSKDTGIYHLVREVVQGGARWTLCNTLATRVIDGPAPTGYRLCHHCKTVLERELSRKV